MPDSEASPFRWRFEALALAGALALACDPASTETSVDYASPVARVGPRTLDKVVVESLAERDDMDESSARAHALDTLRLALAWEEANGALDPQVERVIQRAALARLWLDTEFEPDHQIEDVPKKLVAAAIADPQHARRAFHPQLWMTCQVVIVPRGKGATVPEGKAAREKWEARAYEIMEPIERTVRARWDALQRDDDCTVFFRIAQLFTDRGKDEGYKVKAERFNPAADDPLDATFMEHLTAQREPGILEPFATRFGVHLVMVPKIVEAHLEDGSLPPDELNAARSDEAREGLHPSWQQAQYMDTMQRIREKRVVRIADPEG